MSTLPQEVDFTVAGVGYRLSKDVIPLAQEFLEWAKSKLPDPYENFEKKVKGLSPELQKYAYDKAEEKLARRGSWESPEIIALASSIEGMKKQAGLLLRKYQPHLTEAQVSDLVDKGVEEHGRSFLQIVLGDPRAPLSQNSSTESTAT